MDQNSILRHFQIMAKETIKVQLSKSKISLLIMTSMKIAMTSMTQTWISFMFVD